MFVGGWNGDAVPLRVLIEEVGELPEEILWIPAVIVGECDYVAGSILQSEIESAAESGRGLERQRGDLGIRGEDALGPVIAVLVDEKELESAVGLGGERTQQALQFARAAGGATD